MKNNFHLSLSSDGRYRRGNELMLNSDEVKAMDIRCFEIMEHSDDERYDAFMTIYLKDDRQIFKSWKSLTKCLHWLLAGGFQGKHVCAFWGDFYL